MTQQLAFKTWQWIEFGVLVAVLFVQVGLQLAGHERVAFFVGLPALALLIHAYTWMLPLVREQRRRRR